MTQESLDPQQAEPTADDVLQQEQAAFDAGFAEASGEEQAPPVQEAVEEVEAAPDEPAPEILSEEEIAGLPASKVRELLSKAAGYDALKADYEQHRDRLYGTVGELKKRMQDMSSQPAQAAPAVKLTSASLKRLSGEYPELAQLLSEDLSDAISLGGNAAPAAFDPQQLETLFEQREAGMAERMSKQYETRILSLAHPDWQEAASSSDFKLWKSLQTPETQETLDTSWDSQVLSQGLTAFKGWQTQQQQKTVSKKQRLERAVQPAGVSATSDTASDYDAFLSGFKSVRNTS